MTSKDKVNQAVIQLWLAISELCDEHIENPDQITQEDLNLVMPITNHSAIQNAIAKKLGKRI